MKSLLVSFIVFSTSIAFSQNVGIGTNTPDASAKLDITSTNSGLLIPRISLSSTTDVTTVASPATSVLVYNTNASITNGDGTGYYYFDGTEWVKLITSASSTGGEFQSISGVVQNTTDVANDDFAFGSTSISMPVMQFAMASRFIFDKSKSSFCAGMDDLNYWNSIGNYSASFGYASRAQGAAAFSAGSQTQASADYSVAFGDFTVASGIGSFAAGRDTEATGIYSTAFGYSTNATNASSFAAGYNTNATGFYSTAFGSSSNASGSNSMAVGNNATASGNYSVAFGYISVASGLYSFTAGRNNTSSGSSAFTGGYSNEATNAYSVALGNNNTASGFASFAAGSASQAIANTTIAMGYLAVADTNYAVAIGRNVRANGQNSLATGYYSYAKSFGETVLGIFATDYTPTSINSISTNDRLFAIGNGTGTGARYDAFYIRKNGATGINTSAPTAMLSVSGTANKTGGGSWATFSDKNLKKNITNYNEGIELIKNVHTVNYQYNETMEKFWPTKDSSLVDKVFQGVIAQELQEIAPDMVREVEVYYADKEGKMHTEYYLEVDPSKFTYALINATQEQQEIIEHQEQQLTDQEARIAELERLVHQLLETSKD